MNLRETNRLVLLFDIRSCDSTTRIIVVDVYIARFIGSSSKSTLCSFLSSDNTVLFRVLILCLDLLPLGQFVQYVVSLLSFRSEYINVS